MRTMLLQRRDIATVFMTVLCLLVGSSSHAATAEVYSKKGLGFQLPAAWNVISDNKEGDDRVVQVRANGNATVTLTLFNKKKFMKDSKNKQIPSSLKQFAEKYNTRTSVSGLNKVGPAKLQTAHRLGYSGLVETQEVTLPNDGRSEVIHEHYRVDIKETVVFVTLDCHRVDYKLNLPGFSSLLRSIVIKK